MDGATVSVSAYPNPATKGSNSSHTVRCDFTVGLHETFDLIFLFVTHQSHPIGVYYTSPKGEGISLFSAELKHRSRLKGSQTGGYLALVFSSTECRDQQSYKCQLVYEDTVRERIYQPNSTTTSVEVEGC